MFRQPELLYGPTTSQGGGDTSGLHDEAFVGMINLFLRWMHLSIDDVFCLVELFLGLIFATRVESRKW